MLYCPTGGCYKGHYGYEEQLDTHTHTHTHAHTHTYTHPRLDAQVHLSGSGVLRVVHPHRHRRLRRLVLVMRNNPTNPKMTPNDPDYNLRAENNPSFNPMAVIITMTLPTLTFAR